MNIVDFLHDVIHTIDKYKLNLDAFSYGQLQSKQWIIEELRHMDNPDLGVVFVLCGWYGVLPAMMFYAGINVENIRSFDIDESTLFIADKINKTNSKNDWKFKAVVQDIYEMNFENHAWSCWSNLNNRYSRPITETPNTIINTSCEHTTDEWYDKVPFGTFVILQSNDFLEGEGHINCCKDFNEFSNKYPMTNNHYHGARDFEKYTRFMKMGFK